MLNYHHTMGIYGIMVVFHGTINIASKNQQSTILCGWIPSDYVKIAIENGPVEIVDLPS